MFDVGAIPSLTEEEAMTLTRERWNDRARDYQSNAKKARRSGWGNTVGAVIMGTFAAGMGGYIIPKLANDLKTLDPDHPTRDFLLQGAETCLKKDWLPAAARASVEGKPIPPLPEDTKFCTQQEAKNLTEEKRSDKKFGFIMLAASSVVGIGLSGSFAGRARQKFQVAKAHDAEGASAAGHAAEWQAKIDELKNQQGTRPETFPEPGPGEPVHMELGSGGWRPVPDSVDRPPSSRTLNLQPGDEVVRHGAGGVGSWHIDG